MVKFSYMMARDWISFSRRCPWIQEPRKVIEKGCCRMVAQAVKWEKRRNKELPQIWLLCLYSVFRGKQSPDTAPSPFLNLNSASLWTWITHNPKAQQKRKNQILLRKRSKLPWGEIRHISLCTHAGVPRQKCPLFTHCIWTNRSSLPPVV